MVPAVLNRRRELAELCQRFAVRRLDLFGSATNRGRRVHDSGHSDLDFVAWFEERAGLGPFDQFFGFLEALETLFDRRIDLVDGAAVRNPYFRESLERTSETLYDARGEKAAG